MHAYCGWFVAPVTIPVVCYIYCGLVALLVLVQEVVGRVMQPTTVVAIKTFARPPFVSPFLTSRTSDILDRRTNTRTGENASLGYHNKRKDPSQNSDRFVLREIGPRSSAYDIFDGHT